MKTVTIKKHLTLILVLAALALTACTNLIDTEEKATTNTSAYLKINGSSAARTVTPDYELDKMTDFVLMGKKLENTAIELLATFESYAEMLQATIPIAPGIWRSLTLTAYEEQTAFTATVSNVTIQSGMNMLTFALKPDTAATTAGTGNICVTFTIPSATTVKCVKAGLFDRSTDEAVSGYELETLALNTTKTSVAYEADIVPGTYRLKAWFYADETCTIIVGTYNELVRVVAGNTSQTERNIQLNDTFTITEVFGNGDVSTIVYTRYSDIFILPTMDEMTEKDGYFFDGWYIAKDDTGEQITEISPAQAENVTVYAKWIRGCVVYASELSGTNLTKASYDDTYTVRLLGEWTDSAIKSLGSKIRSITSEKHITLDMTHATNIKTLYNASSYENGTFYNCTALTAVLLPDTLETIGGYTFSGCSSLTSVTIPDSVTTIGSWAFQNCSSLTSITIPDSVTTIGSWAFQNCSALTSVTIPNSVTGIGSWAFQNCSALTSVTIPNSVTGIMESTFSNCSSLTSVTIGNGVTTIGETAFQNCSSLTTIEFTGTVAQWKKINKGTDWRSGVPATKVVCSDGSVSVTL